jgi:acetyl-CoA C-acetyltransferase
MLLAVWRAFHRVQNEVNKHMMTDPWLLEHKSEIYWNMLQTAEQVAKRYNIARELQDQYGVQSQQRASAAQAAGLTKAEMIAVTTTMATVDKVTGMVVTKEVTADRDEGIRADTTYDAGSGIKAATPAV